MSGKERPEPYIHPDAELDEEGRALPVFGKNNATPAQHGPSSAAEDKLINETLGLRTDFIVGEQGREIEDQLKTAVHKAVESATSVN